MGKVILESDRVFSIYTYYFSHGLLLLRSGPTNNHATRIDVLFRDVVCMEIRAFFTGIKIEECDIEYLQPFRSRPIETTEGERKAYSLKSTDWEGFIVAGPVFLHEDNKRFTEKSALLANELPFHL